MKATEIMQMFENQNVVNRADFTHEEYIQQLSAFQAIVSACVFDGDESYHLYNSITRLEELARSRNLKDNPVVSEILISGNNAEERVTKTLEYLERPDASVYRNVYITNGEEETELDTVLVTNNGIIILEIKGAKQDITIAKDGRMLFGNEVSYRNDSIGKKMEKKRRLLKEYMEQELASRGKRLLVRVESCIVFSTPYKARITVTDLYKKERFCYRSQLNRRIENYYSGTCYEEDDLTALNEIISSMECNVKRFQQKLDFAKINSGFAQMVELLATPEVEENPAAEAFSVKEQILNRDRKPANHMLTKIIFPAAVTALCVISGMAVSKFNSR